MTYKLNYDYQSCYSLMIKGTELGEKMPKYSPKFKAKARLKDWIPPNASFFPSANFEGNSEVLPDVTTWMLGNLVLNQRAYILFKELLTKSGELLPISVNEETYYIFNTLLVISDEAVNKESAVEVIDSGVHLGLDNVTYNESALNDAVVFKTSTDLLTYSYCTDIFKTLYEDNDLKGLHFETI